jgi:hypothetical protein
MDSNWGLGIVEGKKKKRKKKKKADKMCQPDSVASREAQKLT